MELACLAQLERSHRRDDEVMAELLDTARRFAAGRPEDGDLARVHEAMAYLQDTVTRHFVDEDGSVFPRLSMRRPELAALLAVLSGEHPTQIAIQAELAAAAKELDGEARPSAGKALLDAATKLAEAHHAHHKREDAIFEGAHAALTEQDDRDIMAEMAMRRGMREKPQPARKARRTATAKLTTKRPAVAAARGSKPAAKTPAANKPAAKTKAAANKPAANKPAAKTKAAANKPAANKPAAKTKAAANKPAANKPAAKTKATANKPAANKPAAKTKATANRPAANKPAAKTKATANRPAANKLAAKTKATAKKPAAKTPAPKQR